jgi:hypothetical protein
MAVPGLGSRFEGQKADVVEGAKMRQQRHTPAYVASWQASGDTAAPHRHSGEKSPDRKAGAKVLFATLAI